MGLDIRTPIGGLFSILGLMLMGYGVFTNSNKAMYEKSLGININIWWGLVMLAFGAVMLFLSLRAAKAAPKTDETSGESKPRERVGVGH